ncbi:helix-turn-helix domain-containing protein [Tsuneonella sp. YG55]|uniref:Helix-turn-helix domain-containing protein n=1 Tax=Tsuneonella litorea TaxID=2976475 RepID=A0A9X2W0F0_9SPHN|nr:helix-turn-helix domain-containing protein [Tsuneonella litorea]MCT2558313.1 helix-turn-helix domain-containing protein [Tsuneonella litorea]
MKGSHTTEPQMRYWQPAPALRALVSGYHLYRIGSSVGEPQTDAFQPAGAILRFTLGKPGNWCVQPPRGSWQAVPPVALFGPSSGITWSRSGPGQTIGVGILPRGWARLSRVPASEWTDRVAEPGEALRIDTTALARALEAAADDDDAIPAILDAALVAAMPWPSRNEDVIAAFEEALLERGISKVEELARRIGRPRHTTERLAKRIFGFPPKLLIRRARFLRSLHALGECGANSPSGSARAIDYGYTDYSHFIRDAHGFLGMSPQAFLKMDNPLLRQSLALRKKVLGAPAQALARGRD